MPNPIPMPPFKAWLASNIPSVFDNTLSYYEELTKLIAYLEQVVIPAVNADIEAVNQLTELFNQLKKYVEDYFKNLDVQEEINNKLDAMAEDGSLETIVQHYLQPNVTWTYDTVTDMQTSDHLISGTYAKTLGYYEKGDGGASTYYIDENGTADGGNVIEVGNLKAHLLYNPIVNIKQFGAVGDGITDDSTALDMALAYGEDKNTKIIFNTNEQYKISGRHFINSNTELDLQGGTILGGIWLCSTDSVTTAGYSGIKNVKIHNGRFYGGTQVILFHSTDITFENILFEDAVQDGHVFDLAGVKGFKCLNCEFYGNKRTTEYFREVIQTDYATSGSQPVWANMGVAAYYDSLPSKDIVVKECTFNKKDEDTYYLVAIGTHSLPTSDTIKDVKVINCTFDGWYRNAIRFYKVENLLVKDCTFIPHELQVSSMDTSSAIDLNLGESLETDTVSSKNIYIEGNNLVSDNTSTDMYFITISEYNSSYATKNISICNNYYSCETGNFAVLGNVNKVKLNNNTINKCVYFISKGTNKVINNLSYANNNISNFTELVRSGSSESSNSEITNFEDSNNIICKTIDNAEVYTNTSSHCTTCTVTSNITLTDPNNSKVSYGTISNKLVSNTNDELRIDRSIKNIKVSGILTAKISSGGKLERIRVRIWDRLAGSAIKTNISRFNGLNSGTDWVSLPVPQVYIKDNNAKDLGSNDARFAVIVDLYGSGTIEVRSEDSYIDITNW